MASSLRDLLNKFATNGNAPDGHEIADFLGGVTKGFALLTLSASEVLGVHPLSL